MLKTIFIRIFARRHFWRQATFSEVAELYASRTLRVIALNMATGFASVYLYKTGYSLEFILGFWAVFFLFKAIIFFPAGVFAAKFGSKYGTLVANLLYIPAMIALGLVVEEGIPALIIAGLFMAISSTLYELCYFVEFSRVKSVANAGKEIGFMNILEKIAVGVSPVIGGFIALIFSPSITMWVAGVIFALAALPLLRTSDQVEKRQRIAIRGFPWRMAMPSMIARGGMGYDVIATGTVWGLFIAISIFPNFDNEIYAVLGILSSITIVVAIIASYTYGKIIDKRRGGTLLKAGVTANSVIHLARAVTTTPVMVVGVNITNEMATTAQVMAYMRGMFDTADLTGHRIMYLVGIGFISSIGSALACAVVIICLLLTGSEDMGIRLFFVTSAVAVLLVMSARFQMYRK